MKISIACDHGGLDLKESLKKWLIENNYEVIDYGTNSKDSCDYPDFGRPACEAVRDKKVDRGIVICTTGIGMSIVANKVKGIRCALVSNTEGASLTRRHNDSNVLALGAKFTSDELAQEITKIWLETEFEGGRHQRRVDKIMEIEK
jgi:ribose 5-phosphate isomerase B